MAAPEGMKAWDKLPPPRQTGTRSLPCLRAAMRNWGGFHTPSFIWTAESCHPALHSWQLVTPETTDAVDPDAKAMEEGGLKLPRARELACLVFGEDLEALAGQ